MPPSPVAPTCRGEREVRRGRLGGAHASLEKRGQCHGPSGCSLPRRQEGREGRDAPRAEQRQGDERDGDAPSPARRPVRRGRSASLPRSGRTGGARDCRAPQDPHGAGRSPPACRSAAPRPAGCLSGGGAWERGLLSSASRAGRSAGQCAVPGAGAARGVLPGPLLQGSTAPGSCAPDLPPLSPAAARSSLGLHSGPKRSVHRPLS